MPRTTTDKATNPGAKYGLADRTRWIDFSAYGMSLKLCVFRDAMALVMEGGDAHPDIVKALGFVKIGDDWIRENPHFRPIEFRAIAPEAVIDGHKPTRDVLIDRRGSYRPVIDWFATFEIGGNEVQAFGATPEAAVKALADAWIGLADTERVDPGLLGKYRGGIAVVPFVSVKRYAKGIGDRLWYTGGMSGDDARFDALIPAPTREHETSPGYR
jgi:hypothetical protein